MMETEYPFEPYLLSPLDHLMPPIYMAAFTSFALEDTASGVVMLENGLHRLVNMLPFLTGNAVLTSCTKHVNVLEVRPSNAQMLEDCPMLHKKVHSQSISYIENSGVFSNSFSAIPLEIAPRDAYPLIRFQANIMRDGIILTTTFFHPAMDGAGAFSIIRALASCCRPTKHPVSLTSPKEQDRIRERIHSFEEGIGALSDTGSYGHIFSLDTPCISRKLVFPTDKLERLRDKCQSPKTPRSDHASRSIRISLSDVASAIIWICVVRARAKANSALPSTSQISSVATTVNTRPILSSFIPEGYAGSATVFVPTSYPASPMVEGNTISLSLIKDLVFRVNRTRKAVNDKHVKAIIAQVNASHDWTSFVLEPPEVGFNNIRHNRLYEWDFGPSLGFVERFEMPDPRIAGACWFLPARNVKEGASSPWEVSLALEENAWVHLEADPLIQWMKGSKRSKL